MASDWSSPTTRSTSTPAEPSLAGNLPIDVDMSNGVCTFVSFETLLYYVDKGIHG
jgi:hypothetical protein